MSLLVEPKVAGKTFFLLIYLSVSLYLFISVHVLLSYYFYIELCLYFYFLLTIFSLSLPCATIDPLSDKEILLA